MSDPVANAEIEDVLLSIRRLVQGDREAFSSNAGGEKSPSNLRPLPTEPTQSGEALVLTPALRVNDTESEERADHPEAPLWQADADDDKSLDPENPTDIVGASEPSRFQVFWGSDDADLDAEDNLDAEQSPDSDDEEEMVDTVPSFVRAVARDLKDIDDDAFDFRKVPAKPRPEVGDAGDEAELQVSRNEPRAGFRFGADDPSLSDENGESRFPLNMGAFSDRRPLDSSLSHLAGGAEATKTADLSAEDKPVLDGVERFRTKDDHDDSDLPAEQSAYRSDADTSDNLFDAESLTLDEAALKELVTELVHRELQGELGERITRNVRKLVRREIHRVLAARDFD